MDLERFSNKRESNKQELEEKIQGLLMSFEEYNKKNFFKPYIYEIEKEKQKLVYFGAEHSIDPQDDQFEKLREQWKLFLEKSKPTNSIILIEGARFLKEPKRPEDILPIQEDEIISKAGEIGFILHLASENGYKIECPEPSFKKRMDTLSKNFSRDKIIYSFLAEYITPHRIKRKEKLSYNELNERISKFLNYLKEESRWADFDFSADRIKEIHRELFSKEFDISDDKFFDEISSPLNNIAITNEIIRADSLLRDLEIVKLIKKYWEERKNIFIVYGSSHAIIQEPALKELLK